MRARLLAESVRDVTKPFSAHELRARAQPPAMKLAREVPGELASQGQDLTGLMSELVANRRITGSEHRWRAIYEHSPVGIALADSLGADSYGEPCRFRDMLG